MNVITAPDYSEVPRNHFKVFLAGTIDNGDSDNWQQEVINRLEKKNLDYLTVFNPRRSDWPESSEHNLIRGQIEWELQRLKESDLIIMNILPDSKSPISLLEMGLFLGSYKANRLIVFCTPEFYRFDNVSVTMEYWPSAGLRPLLVQSNKITDIINEIIYSYKNR